MSSRLAASLAVLGAITMIGMGCGGGDDSSSTSGSTATESSTVASSGDKAEFIKAAEALCLKKRQGSFERIAAYEKKHGSEGLPPAVLGQKAIRAVVLATIDEEIDGLRALEPPAGEEEEVEALLASLQKTLEKARSRTKKLAVQQAPAALISAVFHAADKELKAYGLLACAK